MGITNRIQNLPSSDTGSAQDVLFELQVEQHHHDEAYHREIARLPLHQRLNHMALHFAKYAGKVAAAPDDGTLVAVYTDVLVIAVSSANILNEELWDLINRNGQQHPSLLAYGRALALALGDMIVDRNLLLRETTIAAGRIAAACEKIDHLENVHYRDEIGVVLARLVEFALAVIARHGTDPAHSVRQRLADVKQRLKLHGRV